MIDPASSNGGAVGIYGKVAAQGDFIRSNAGQFSRAGMDEWFQAGIEVLHKEATTLPPEQTAFLIARETASTAFMGVFVPSRDAVGRSFPLIIFVEATAANQIDEVVALPGRYQRFFDEAGALVVAGTELAAADLVTRSQELTLNEAGAGADRSAWTDEPSTPLVNALGGSPQALAYAMRTFVSACDQAAKLDSGGSAIVVDAPAPTRATREMWLECVRRRFLPAAKRISAFWTEGPAGRLLLALGVAPPAVLSYLANPRHRASRFWPLRTEVASALDQAEKALTADQRRRVADPGTVLGDLVATFCPGESEGT